jgi:hypothetical protein
MFSLIPAWLAYIMQSGHLLVVWMKPSAKRYKYNIDVSFSHFQNKMIIGICICDDQWRLMVERTEWISRILEAEVGEATGLLIALIWNDLLYDMDF